MALRGNWLWLVELNGVQRDFLKLLKMWWNWVSDRPCPEMAVHMSTGSQAENLICLPHSLCAPFPSLVAVVRWDPGKMNDLVIKWKSCSSVPFFLTQRPVWNQRQPKWINLNESVTCLKHVPSYGRIRPDDNDLRLGFHRMTEWNMQDAHMYYQFTKVY